MTSLGMACLKGEVTSTFYKVYKFMGTGRDRVTGTAMETLGEHTYCCNEHQFEGFKLLFYLTLGTEIMVYVESTEWPNF